MLTNFQLVEFVKAVYAAKWVYWYGTVGYKCTEPLYTMKAKQYPTHYTASRKAGYMADIAAGRMCADCVGMIKAFFWMGGDIHGKNVYASNGCPDTSANGMIALCKKQGPIKTMPDIPGLVVWKSGHIGVYIGGGYTIEERGFNYDCQKRKLSDGPWTKWGKLPASMLQYVTDGESTEPEQPEGERILRNGCEGEDVRALQTALIELGYDCGRWGADGDFGDATEQAVQAFQSDAGIDPDGEVGPLTRIALEKAVEALEPPQKARHVEIVGGNYYVRSAPNTHGTILGVARDGYFLPYGGETSPDGWLLVDYDNRNGWVSGKGGRLVE